MRGTKILLLFIGLTTSLNSCTDQGNEHQHITLIDAVHLERKSAFELQLVLDLSNYDLPTSAIQYDVDIYKVTYRTLYKGEEIVASGIVSLPDTDNPMPMISFQHGTIVAHYDAPTRQTSTEAMFLYGAFASAGLISVFPDFIGFGSSSEIFHPYYIEEYTASAIIDNLKAASELAEMKGRTFNQNLFLAGYSEGGYATMAVHKSIEQNGLSGFNLVASFPASGGYDVKDVQERFFMQTEYSEPFYLPYVVLAYKNTYEWEQPLPDFFNEPYASSIPTLFDGTKNGIQINSSLTNDIPGLVNNDLLANIDTDENYQYFVDALESNSLTDWAPAIKMYMYHGDADTTVPYENSVITYEQFLSNGASPSTVEFITLPGADHDSGIEPYVEDFLPKLLSLTSARRSKM